MMDKTVLITGATAGIGSACAEIFARNGARIVLCARRRELLEARAEELSVKYNVDVYTIELDIRDRQATTDDLGNLPDGWQDIDILINNAGLASGLTKLHEGNIDDWERMIDTNIKGLLYVSRAILPGMAERGSGMVINIGSIAGEQTYPLGNVYCGSKAAVKAISQGMIIDLNGTGVRVCNIEPGLVETEFALVRFHGDNEKAGQVYMGYTPLTGQDIADIAYFCATRPKHVMIQEILVTPTDQATATIVDKKL